MTAETNTAILANLLLWQATFTGSIAHAFEGFELSACGNVPWGPAYVAGFWDVPHCAECLAIVGAPLSESEARAMDGDR